LENIVIQHVFNDNGFLLMNKNDNKFEDILRIKITFNGMI